MDDYRLRRPVQLRNEAEYSVLCEIVHAIEMGLKLAFWGSRGRIEREAQPSVSYRMAAVTAAAPSARAEASAISNSCRG